MTHIALGILRLPNGLYYFGAPQLYRVLLEFGLSQDEAAAAVGILVAKAIDAEQVFTG